MKRRTKRSVGRGQSRKSNWPDRFRSSGSKGAKSPADLSPVLTFHHFGSGADPPDPDEHFAPFYKRVGSGDLSAFVDFYRAHGLSPGAAFYQCIGYLAAHGSVEETKIVQKIISINLHGGPRTSSSTSLRTVFARPMLFLGSADASLLRCAFHLCHELVLKAADQLRLS
jgi:hypothetical protein